MNNQSGFHFLPAFIAEKTLDLNARTFAYAAPINISTSADDNAAFNFSGITRFLLY